MPFDFKAESPDATVAATAYLFGADSQSAADPSIYQISDILALVAAAGSSGQMQYNSAGAFAGANLWIEGANTVALRNSTTAQSFYAYNTYTDASNYERGMGRWSSNVYEVGNEAAGTGTLRDLKLTAANIRINATSAWGNARVDLGNQADGTLVVPTGAYGAGGTWGYKFRIAETITSYLGTLDASNGYLDETVLNSTVNGSTAFTSHSCFAFNPRVLATDTATYSLYGLNAYLENKSAALRVAAGAITQFFHNTTASTSLECYGSIFRNWVQANVTALTQYGGQIDIYQSRTSAAITARYYGLQILSWAEAGPTYNSKSAALSIAHGPTNANVDFLKLTDWYESTIYLRVKQDGTLSLKDNAYLLGEASNVLALRNGTSAQSSYVYNTWIDVSNYERGMARWSSNIFEIGTAAAGTGTLRNLKLTAAAIDINANMIFGDAKNIEVNTTTGTKIGTATTQKLGFFNATPVVQPAEITDELTTITHTAPGTPDYAVQDLIDSSGGAAFGFATKDEGNTVLSVVANLQARVNGLENALSSLGLIADAD